MNNTCASCLHTSIIIRVLEWRPLPGDTVAPKILQRFSRDSPEILQRFRSLVTYIARIEMDKTPLTANDAHRTPLAVNNARNLSHPETDGSYGFGERKKNPISTHNSCVMIRHDEAKWIAINLWTIGAMLCRLPNNY
eukprot:1332302-Amorphochlora_amoeboformis.AAC.1